MHIIVITPYPLQGSMLIQSFKRENIEGLSCSPRSLSHEWHPNTDAIIFPHKLNEEMFSDIEKYLLQVSPNTPLVFLTPKPHHLLQKSKREHLLKQSLFLDQSIQLDELPEIIKEIMHKSEDLKGKSRQFQVGNVILDRSRRLLIQEETIHSLSKKEFFLLELLMLNHGQVVTRERIIDYVWDRRGYVARNTIDVYISRLRKKLKDGHCIIRTISSLGYEFKLQD